MSKYVKEFFKRGLMFGGFGPITMAIVFWAIDIAGAEQGFAGGQVLLATISTYIIAFVQAGASVFNQIEGWSLGKSLGIHLSVLYVTYLGCYLINSWIPFVWQVVAIFTAIFVAVYLVIWLTVYLIVKHTSKKLNQQLNK